MFHKIISSRRAQAANHCVLLEVLPVKLRWDLLDKIINVPSVDVLEMEGTPLIMWDSLSALLAPIIAWIKLHLALHLLESYEMLSKLCCLEELIVLLHALL